MSRRVYLLGLGLALVALVALALAVTDWALSMRPGVTEANFKRIQPGMTMQQVETLLGGPGERGTGGGMNGGLSVLPLGGRRGGRRCLVPPRQGRKPRFRDGGKLQPNGSSTPPLSPPRLAGLVTEGEPMGGDGPDSRNAVAVKCSVLIRVPDGAQPDKPLSTVQTNPD